MSQTLHFPGPDTETLDERVERMTAAMGPGQAWRHPYVWAHETLREHIPGMAAWEDLTWDQRDVWRNQIVHQDDIGGAPRDALHAIYREATNAGKRLLARGDNGLGSTTPEYRVKQLGRGLTALTDLFEATPDG